MKHVMMGLKFVFFVGLYLACVGTVIGAVGVIATMCGDYVAIGICIALVLLVLGVTYSYDGG